MDAEQQGRGRGRWERTVCVEVHDLLACARLWAQDAHLFVQLVALDLRGSSRGRLRLGGFG